MPAAGERSADTDEPTVQVDEQLDVAAGPAVLPGVQILAVPPVDGRHQRPVEKADLAGNQHRRVGVGGAEHVGEEGHHRLVVVPRGRAPDAEAFVQVVVGGVATQPAQRQPQRIMQRQLPRPADRLVPVEEVLLG